MAHQIHFLAPSTHLTRGATLQVPIKIELDQPLKFRGIRASFRGAEETKADYTTTSTDSKGHTTTHHHTAVEYHEIVSQAWLLRGAEKLGFIAGVSDAVATMFGGGRHEVLQPGEHLLEVTLTIPDDAPPTHVGNRTRVFYELSVQIDIPLGRDAWAQQSFTVDALPDELPDAASIRIQYPGDEGLGFFDKVFSPDVRIDLAIASDQYFVGELIEGMFHIEAASPLKCRAIRARIVSVEHSRAHGHTDSYVHQGSPVIIAEPGTLTAPLQQEFSLPAEAVGPLTAKGQLFSITNYVQFELDVPWAKDPTIRAPITLLPALADPA